MTWPCGLIFVAVWSDRFLTHILTSDVIAELWEHPSRIWARVPAGGPERRAAGVSCSALGPSVWRGPVFGRDGRPTDAEYEAAEHRGAQCRSGSSEIQAQQVTGWVMSHHTSVKYNKSLFTVVISLLPLLFIYMPLYAMNHTLTNTLSLAL